MERQTLPIRFAVGQVFVGERGQRVEIVKFTPKRIAAVGIERDGRVSRLSPVTFRAHLIAIGGKLAPVAPPADEEAAVLQAIRGPIQDLPGVTLLP